MKQLPGGWVGAGLTLTFALLGQQPTSSIPVPTIPSIGGSATPAPGNVPPSAGDLQRPIFLSGKVALEDGTPPPEPVMLEMVCGGEHRPAGYTDAKGRFDFDLTHRSPEAAIVDASEGGASRGTTLGGLSSLGQTANQRGGTNGANEMTLNGCDLEAVFAGFRSDRVTLANRHSGDNPAVGTLILHRRGNVQGLTISVTSEMAPKEARKAFEKGRAALHKGKWDNAGREFEKAVGIYPQYAVAWYGLGQVQQRSNVLEARKSYARSLAADPKFVSPYLQLAGLAAKEGKWDEVAANTRQLLKLNPVDFPQAWFYQALSDYQMRKMDVAEQSAREGLTEDRAHRAPKLEFLLGVILAEKKDYPGAAEHLRAYLELVPKAPDAAMIGRQLAELDKLARAK